jgi:argininosuccinate lyase
MRAAPAPEMMRFTESLSVDQVLGVDDIEGSKAHVRALGRAKVLTPTEVNSLIEALSKVGREFETGTFAFDDGDEDVHTAIERRVTELAGELGGRLHTGRSRNDQVATALRLYSRRRITQTADGVLRLCETLLDRARSVGDAEIPAYTHLQRAQRVPLAWQLSAHGWSLLRDVDRLFDSRRRVEVSPLGAGAVGGTSLPIDPSATARDLGFEHAFENPIDAVSDRDFVAETLFVLALLGVHLSRIGEEIAIYSTSEFGFYALDDAWATGSSMLPQKKNPDVAELARAKSGRLIGHLTGFLATLKGLPFAYNRDLQEDKEPLFDSFTQVDLALDALHGVVATMRFELDVMRNAASDPNARAVELAEWMVLQGAPFREAHGRIAELVSRSVEEQRPLPDLVCESEELGPQAVSVFGSAPRISLSEVSEKLDRFAQAIESRRENLRIADDAQG